MSVGTPPTGTPENTPEGEYPKLSVTVKEKEVLAAAYMPYLTSGGLFIPTQKIYKMGDKIELQVQLALEGTVERMSCLAEVAWITPPGTQGNRPQGVGLVFLDAQGIQMKNEIEMKLGALLVSGDYRSLTV